MSAKRLRLHIGAMKTGTTYVQGMLARNRERLALAGVLYPEPWSDQVEAVRDVLGLKGGSHLGSIDGSWSRMVGQLHDWADSDAIISVEFLSFAKPDQVRQIVADLGEAEVSVVLGARDLARVLPAQWATAVRNGRTTTYRDYIEGVTRGGRSSSKRHFWNRQDIGRIASVWAKQVGPENVTVVTVPPRGADPTRLWQRMAQAMQIDGLELESTTPSNESLGPTATELLRRINIQSESIEMSTWAYQHGVNRALSHKVLPGVPDPHPGLTVPPEYHDWLRDESDRVIEEIRASGVNVIGDIADLNPKLDQSHQHVWPEELPTEELLGIAVSALTGLADKVATDKRQQLQGGGKKRGRGQLKDKNLQAEEEAE